MGFEEIEHTADIAIIAHGATLEELFESAALGCFSFVWDMDPGDSPSVEREIVILDGSTEVVLHHWLAELLYLHERERLLFLSFRVESVSPSQCTAVAEGIQVENLADHVRHSIKAVTYHDLDIQQDEQGFHTKIVFDV